MPASYRELHLSFSTGPDGLLRCKAATERATAIATSPLTPASARRLSAALVPYASGTTRHARPPAQQLDQPSLREAGREIFRAVFRDAVADLYQQTCGTDDPEAGVRLLIHIAAEDPALSWLAAIPWEIIEDPSTGHRLGTDRLHPIARFLETPAPVRRLRFEPPLTILAVASRPANLSDLDLPREREQIEKAWQATEGAKVSWLEKADPDLLYGALRRQSYHVLHYMGHGEFDPTTGGGSLAFEGTTGSARSVSGHRLREILQGVAPPLLAVLTACETARSAETDGPSQFAGVAPSILQAGIPAVLAMQAPIADEAAIELTRAFYGALAAGEPVDAAAAAGRLALSNDDSAEWAIPTLFMRVRDGHLFEVIDAAKTKPAAEGDTVVEFESSLIEAPKVDITGREGAEGGDVLVKATAERIKASEGFTLTGRRSQSSR